jgi:isoquinoline 1-oxidoreductase beta subunit
MEQNNFDAVRMGEESTKIHVEIVATTHAPGGIGEPSVPPIAPAITYAIFALTDKRIREFGVVSQLWS